MKCILGLFCRSARELLAEAPGRRDGAGLPTGILSILSRLPRNGIVVESTPQVLDAEMAPLNRKG